MRKNEKVVELVNEYMIGNDDSEWEGFRLFNKDVMSMDDVRGDVRDLLEDFVIYIRCRKM